MFKNNNPERAETKKTWADMKNDFKVAVKDKKRWLICGIELLIAFVLIVVDLLLKKYLWTYCDNNGDVIVIDGVFSFTSVKNTGASFGIFGDSTLALTVVSLVCSAILIFFIFYSYPRRNLWLRSALVMVTAGAIGNVYDRLALGYVRDFVHFEIRSIGFDFPVWNFADTCLTVGTVLLIIYIIFFYSKEEEAKREEREKLRLEQAKTNSNPDLLKEEVVEGSDAEHTEDHD